MIAWDGQTLAADRRCTRGGTVYAIRKLHRVGDIIVGLSGGSDFCQTLLSWFEAGRPADAFPETQKHEDYACALFVHDGKVFTIDRSPHPVEMLEPICAIGSGREVALGAMTVGATAVQAVAAASRWCDSCGNGVDSLTPSGAGSLLKLRARLDPALFHPTPPPFEPSV